jgi:RHS repeat-associated protein
LGTDSAGSVVWRWENDSPFGANAPAEDPDGDGQPTTVNLRFPGQYFDQETGLHYNYFRYYDPETGRYIISDPIGIEGGINTYAYVLASPLNRVDPDGLLSLLFFGPRKDVPVQFQLDLSSMSTGNMRMGLVFGTASALAGSGVTAACARYGVMNTLGTVKDILEIASEVATSFEDAGRPPTTSDLDSEYQRQRSEVIEEVMDGEEWRRRNRRPPFLRP